MRKTLILAAALIGSAALAQANSLATDTTVQRHVDQSIQAAEAMAASSDTAWKIGGNFGLQFNQASYSNWQAGGVNSIAANTLLSLFANYDNGGKWTWNNSLNLAYGLAYQDTVFNKTDDRIELESRMDYRLSEKWNVSAFLNFRSQFMPGFDAPGLTEDSLKISDFLAPGYVLTGVGATYKPNKNLSVYISPLTSKMTIVRVQHLADMGAFGVEKGETFRAELGGYLNLAYNRSLWENVDLQFRMDLFSNYLEDPTLIDVNSELIMFFKVNKFLTANLAVAYLYDHDVKFDVEGKLGVPRSQWRQILSLGLTYQFGDKRS
jgi:hypothetical protein